MKSSSQQVGYFFGSVVIAILLGFTYYLQTHDGVNPCPLCVLQRIDLVILGVIFLIGAALPVKKTGAVIVGILTIFISLVGVLLSGRQVWLQHLPPSEEMGCGVSLNYLMHMLPLNEVIKKVFAGTAECSQKAWSFFHLSLAEWSLIWFGIFLIFSLIQLANACRRKHE